MTMALAFGLLLELGDPASKWGPYWDSFPPAAQVPNIFDFEGDLVRMFFLESVGSVCLHMSTHMYHISTLSPCKIHPPNPSYKPPPVAPGGVALEGAIREEARRHEPRPQGDRYDARSFLVGDIWGFWCGGCVDFYAYILTPTHTYIHTYICIQTNKTQCPPCSTSSRASSAWTTSVRVFFFKTIVSSRRKIDRHMYEYEYEYFVYEGYLDIYIYICTHLIHHIPTDPIK